MVDQRSTVRRRVVSRVRGRWRVPRGEGRCSGAVLARRADTAIGDGVVGSTSLTTAASCDARGVTRDGPRAPQRRRPRRTQYRPRAAAGDVLARWWLDRNVNGSLPDAAIWWWCSGASAPRRYFWTELPPGAGERTRWLPGRGRRRGGGDPDPTSASPRRGGWMSAGVVTGWNNGVVRHTQPAAASGWGSYPLSMYRVGLVHGFRASIARVAVVAMIARWGPRGVR